MGSVLIYNIGRMISGDVNDPVIDADSLFIQDGVFQEIGTRRKDADIVIDARGNTAAPGLIDSHVHLSFGDWTPVQNSTNWISCYMQCGITRMVSAGELHLPGLPIDKPDPQIFRSLALVTRACYDNYRPAGVKVEAGTLLLVPGLKEEDIAAVGRCGSKLVKFIFYPYGDNPEEQAAYMAWARKYGLKVKIHSGGVSRSGVSKPADAELILSLAPDIAGHINGGPIPPSEADVKRVVDEGSCYLEVAYCGNAGLAVRTVQWAAQKGCLDRVILGSDTPSGTGVTPRALLRTMALAATAQGVEPEQAVCMATGSAALAHNLDSGFIAEGKPADLVILGRIQGSTGADAMEALKAGNLLAVSMALIDGELTIKDRSTQTPPPEVGAKVVAQRID
ncbi:MAG: amidohydrolase family protein [Desulfarculaceae bacterium]|jgi:enamidase